MLSLLASHWLLLCASWIVADVGFVVAWARWRAPVRPDDTWDERFYGES